MSLRSEVVRIFNELVAGSKKISQLPPASTLVGPELMEIVQDGENRKATASQFGGGSGATAFTQLTDVPATYVGAGGLAVTVKADETGLEFTSGGGAGTVQSVTGDGVDNTDPANPVLTYPTIGDIGAEAAGAASAVQGNLTAHISDATDAHAGSAITNTPAGNISSTDVQGAINELDAAIVAAATPAASETVAGKAELATQAETNTGSDDLRIVTPLKLATWWTNVKTLAQTFSLSLKAKQIAGDYGVLTDGVTISWDANSIGNTGQVTLGGNRTLAAITNPITGAWYVLRVVQDGTGGRTLAFNAAYTFPNSITPTLNSAAAEVTVFQFFYDGTNFRCMGILAQPGSVADFLAGTNTVRLLTPSVWDTIKDTATHWVLGFLSGTGNRLVQASSTGALSASAIIVDEGYVTDSDVIAAITATTFASFNSFTATITPAASKVMYQGQKYKAGAYLYEAILDNTVMRLSGGGAPLIEVTDDTYTILTEGDYISYDDSTRQILTLPATAYQGYKVTVLGRGTAGWRVGQNALDTIKGVTNSTAGTGGYIQSGSQYDNVTLECIIASGSGNTWTVVCSKGTLTVV